MNEMMSIRRPGLLSWCLLMLTTLLTGCMGSSQPDFVGSKRLDGLTPYAREAVQAVIKDKFGSPSSLRCPTTTVIATGDVRGTVALEESKATQETLDKLNTTSDLSIEDPMELTSKSIRFVPTLDQQFAAIEKLTEKENAAIKDYLAAVVSESRPITFNAEKTEITLAQPVKPASVNESEFILDECRALYRGQQLYMLHCVHCHGVSGDGNGASAKYMNPRPRDYRQGVFKFTSTAATSKASTADIKHIIADGIAGTYMPSFKLLSEDDLTSITNYVKFLAFRGELENRLINEVAFEYSQKAYDERIAGGEKPEEIETLFKDYLAQMFPDIVSSNVDLIAADWTAADEADSVITPQGPRPEPDAKSLADATKTSIENGHLLFLTKGQCAACHGENGRGDGVQTRAMQANAQGDMFAEPGLHDEWGNLTPPRDFRTGVLRGGRRPVDIYRRIHSGIKGTKMPPAGASLTEEEIWDLVNYVLVMSNSKGQPSPIPAAKPTTEVSSTGH
jgi:mono/diheme cytochrome c family protein